MTKPMETKKLLKKVQELKKEMEIYDANGGLFSWHEEGKLAQSLKDYEQLILEAIEFKKKAEKEQN